MPLNSIREFLVILISILAAFSLDAWWQDRNAKIEFNNQQKSLLEEFADNRRKLDETIRHHEFALEETRVFLAALLDVPDGETTYIRAETIAVALATPTLDPSTGGLQSFIASGGLAEVQSGEARSEIAGWSGIVSDSSEDEVWAVDFVGNRLIPYLESRVDLTHILDYRVNVKDGQKTGHFPNDPVVAPMPIVRTTVLANLLAKRRKDLGVSVGALTRTSDHLDKIISSLGESLEDE
jgi:hypothetical protein